MTVSDLIVHSSEIYWPMSNEILMDVMSGQS